MLYNMQMFITNIFSTLFGGLALPNIFNDAPAPWQLGFQDSATPGFTGLVTLHNTIGFYLIVISFSVFWVLFSIIYYYSSNKNPIAHKYLTHGTVLELIWTITPALILIAIAFPSFRLLYLMDCPICVYSFIASSLFAEKGVEKTLEIIVQFSVMPVTKLTPIKSLNNKCLSLIPYGTIGSTTLIGLNNYVRNETPFPNKIISQLIGHLLGDGSINYSKTSITPYFVFTQTQKRFNYLWFVFQQLSHYCGRYPLLSVSFRNGKRNYFLSVVTRSYPKLSNLYQLFYTIKMAKE